MRRIVAFVVLFAVMLSGCAGDARRVARAPVPGSDSSELDTVAGSDPAAQSSFELESLKEDLSALSSGWDGKVALGVTDLQTGQSISVNGAERLSAASTIKIFVVMVVAQDIDAGRYLESDVDDLVRAAMGLSDNAATRELLARAGGGDVGNGVRRVNNLMVGLGATQSIMTGPPGYPESFTPDDDNYLTADDLNLMLGKLYRGEALSPSATAFVLSSMALPEAWQNQSLGAPLPADVKFLHKPGWLDDAWNDAGIVVFDRRGEKDAYVISYLSNDVGIWQEAFDRGATVSDVVWRHFDGAYPGSSARYFPETGLAIGGGFLGYWNHFAGLPVVGYPLTGEIAELDVTTQYFERARFEWHPGLAPDHFDVLLGLLGHDVAAIRNLPGTPPFQPSASNNSCTFFPSTGHNLCGGFRDYWNQFGGLAVYGFPISEEFQGRNSDDGKVYTVQYFERQRFEWHPGEWPERYDVMLGRLSAEVVPNGA